MRKVFSVAAVLAIGVVVVAASSVSQAQPFYGPGMMSGYRTGWGCFGSSGYWGNPDNLNLSTDEFRIVLSERSATARIRRSGTAHLRSTQTRGFWNHHRNRCQADLEIENWCRFSQLSNPRCL